MKRRESIARVFEAAREGRTAEVVSFLSSGISPDQLSPQDFFNLRLLHETVAGDHADTVAAVIACGADKEACDRGGNCPITLSSTLGSWITSLVLLGAGCVADAPNIQGLNQEAVARLHGHHGLADFISRINVVRRMRANPLTPPSQPHPPPPASILFEAMEAGLKFDLLEHFASGAPLDALNAEGEALTHVGSRCGHGSLWCDHAGTLATALACGVSADALNRDGETGLHTGAAAGSYYACLILLAAGANPAAFDGDGFTPSTRARKAGHDPLASLIDNIEQARAFYDRSRALAAPLS